VTVEELRFNLEAIFTHSAYLSWYCQNSGCGNLDFRQAAENFLDCAKTEDVSPVRFFDPEWFRSLYSVVGPNAFLSYISDTRQRLAWPSPLFWPRWYSRRNKLSALQHPFLHYLLRPDEQSPHPLLDIAHLKKQMPACDSRAIAQAFITEISLHRLTPHPQFDSGRYLDTNPDVAAAKMNPLEHYLYFGSRENRAPNHIFNVAWYKEIFLDRMPNKQASRYEPLTHYVHAGMWIGHTPAPGLGALIRATAPISEHGPRQLIECIEHRRNIYAQLKFRPEISPHEFSRYMDANIQKYNPQFISDQVLLLRRARVAIMFSAKCASANIVGWWLEKAGLLPFMLRFSHWVYDDYALYAQSREYIEDALSFDPGRYKIYKFVRHPLGRAVSSFTHYLMFPYAFGVSQETTRTPISFMDFLDHLRQTNYLGSEKHFRPQYTEAEKGGLLSPTILRIEDGLQPHLASLERKHGLAPATFDRMPEIRNMLRFHNKQPWARWNGGPTEKIPFGQIPKSRPLLTAESVAAIYDLFREDFDAYGYRPQV
jgi:hypothetical protein